MGLLVALGVEPAFLLAPQLRCSPVASCRKNLRQEIGRKIRRHDALSRLQRAGKEAPQWSWAPCCSPCCLAARLHKTTSASSSLSLYSALQLAAECSTPDRLCPVLQVARLARCKCSPPAARCTATNCVPRRPKVEGRLANASNFGHRASGSSQTDNRE